MKLKAYGYSQASEPHNFDCLCVGPLVGPQPVRLEVDTSSTFIKNYGLLTAVADANPENGVLSSSRILLDELSERFYSRQNKGTNEIALRKSMGDFLDEANQALLSRLADENRVGSSTTLSGFALLEGEVLVVFHIGNCRVLRHTGGYLRPLTEDHAEFRNVYRGRIEQATVVEEGEPELTRYIGILGTGMPDVRVLTWSEGDTLMAGTRGWHGTKRGIARDAIKSALNAYPDLSTFVERSVKEAVRADGQADATMVAVRVEE